MDERQLQNPLIALLLPALALFGLSVTIGFDPYLKREKKRTLLLIEAIVMTLIADNIVELAVTEAWKPEYVFLKTFLDIYSYAARPVVITLFIYTVWDDSRRRLFWIPVGLNAAVYLTALVKPWTFGILPDGMFYRGPLGYTAHLVSGFLLVSILVIMLRLRDRKGGKATIIPLTNVGVAALGPLLDAGVNQNGIITFTELTTVYCCIFYFIWLHQQYVREHERALREGQRVQLMLSQIKPHFLYNTLNAVGELCDDDPQQAKTAIDRFAQYLRGNMASIGQDKPIPFTQELEHTRIYLEIEQMRFEDKLRVHYDIACTDFMIPALTLEPLVENAVRHGVRGSEDGSGTVCISTRRVPEGFEVVVSDDGPGFVPSQPPRDGRPHLGITNVSERLAQVCGGTLDIQTAPGKGTTVTILLPMKGTQKPC